MGTAAAVRGQFVLEMIEKLKGDIEGSGMFPCYALYLTTVWIPSFNPDLICQSIKA